MRTRIAMLALVLAVALSQIGAKSSGSFSGSLYGATATATSTCPNGSGWKRWPGGVIPQNGALTGLVPSDVAGAETLVVVLRTALDSAGTDSSILNTFTTVTSSNASEFVAMGGLPAYGFFCVSHTITGSPSAPGHTFKVYASYQE